MMKKVDVVFFVEHKDRELKNIEAVAEKLKKKGISSIIVSVYFHVAYLYLYRAKVFIFPYLLRKSDWPVSLVYDMHGDKVKYMNMNWEQLLSPLNEACKRPSDNFVKEVVHHIAWTDSFKNYLTGHGVAERNITVTGNPAYDTLCGLLTEKDSWREKLAKEYDLDIKKKWLFMPMNYGWAFFSNHLLSLKVKNGFPEEAATEYRDYSQKCLKKFVSFIVDVAEKYDWEIIVRPHPSISEEQYATVFKNEIGKVPSTVTLNKGFSIREWIVASDIVGSSWSTSVWDAVNIGKPGFLFTPYERPAWLNVWWNDEVINVNTFSEIPVVASLKDLSTPAPMNVTDNVANLISDRVGEVASVSTKFKLKLDRRLVVSFLTALRLVKWSTCKYDYFKKKNKKA